MPDSNFSKFDVYTLIFTSGTTSLPKAVMISHMNLCATAETMVSQRLLDGHYTVQDNTISYLPLAHIYMRALQSITVY